MSSLAQKLKGDTQCEVRCDDLTRQLYATDGSVYQIVPQGVAFPRNAAEAAGVIRLAQTAGVSVSPRGAGTGLAGGALGEGLVVDLARHNTGITGLNVETRTVRVGAGVVLDQLNAYLKPHGYCFGPDVATSSRATLGGMIGNNSSGARVPFYGTTIDHVLGLDVVLCNGDIQSVSKNDNGLAGLQADIDRLIAPFENEITERFHSGIIKRWPGFGLDKYLKSGRDFTRIFGGSEGTLAAVMGAELKISPLPKEKGLALFFFASVAEAMQATVEFLEYKPAAIEHIDDVLFNQTRDKSVFAEARAFLQLDDAPCKSILIVEFYENIADNLAAMENKNLGLRRLCTRDSHEMELVWNVRKAGLVLLTSCKGDAKPTAGIEDVAVPPAQLPDYVNGLMELMRPLGTEASYYGHAASGLLHVRPVLDLHKAEDITRYRQIAESVSALTRQFKGSLAAEHGVGKGRAEFMPEHLGPLLGLMSDIKKCFDPKGLMNPGTIFPLEKYRFDNNLRQGADNYITLPFEAKLAFARRDESFVANLEQCNGNGACKKLTPTMCPTFLAMREEKMSTRGRANTIRAALEHRLPGDDPLLNPDLNEALASCLSCKACKTECPSNVDMALQKAELLHARWKKYGAPLGVRILSRVDRLGAMAGLFPSLSNRILSSGIVREIMEQFLGVAREAYLPSYAAAPFARAFDKRKRPPETRGSVYLWDDCYARHNEPQIAHAAVTLLEAAGFRVERIKDRACCGRPAFSMGMLDTATDFARHNLGILKDNTAPVIFLEPSCYSMFADDYRELGFEDAGRIAQHCFLLEDFLEAILAKEPDALSFKPVAAEAAIHAHCHSKALAKPATQEKLLKRVPGLKVRQLPTACCGMAGAYGVKRQSYAWSQTLGDMYAKELNALDGACKVIATGTSCRHQAQHLGERHPRHIAEVLAEALQK